MNLSNNGEHAADLFRKAARSCRRTAWAMLLVALGAHAQILATWNSIGPPGGTVSVLLAHPTWASTLYAATRENGVFFSTDAGQTWRVANTGLVPTTAIGRQALYAVYALASDGQYLYAATASGIYYAAAGTTPSWTRVADTGATTAINLLAFDPGTKRLYAASTGSDGVSAPRVYVTALDTSQSAPFVSWNGFDLSLPPSSINSLTIVPALAGLPGTLLLGAGNSIFASSILSGADLTLTLSDVTGTSLQGGPVAALTYGPDLSQAYLCSGGGGFSSGTPADPLSMWLPFNVVPPFPASINCNTFYSVPSSLGGGSQVLLGTDQGAYVLSSNGTDFLATGALSISAGANSFAAVAGPSGTTLFVGGGFGVSSTPLMGLTGGSSWTAGNGPASVAQGGSNGRLNNVNVVDAAVIGDRLFAATQADEYNEVFSSSDGGATWSTTNIRTALSDGSSVTTLAADVTNSILYAGTTQGLFTYSVNSGQWSAIGASGYTKVSSLTLGSASLFIGTDAGVYTAARGASTTPQPAGLSSVGVRALLLANGNVYAATRDPNTEISNVSFAAEAEVTSGNAMWSPFGTTAVGTRSITSLLRVGDLLLAGTDGEMIKSASLASPWVSASTSASPASQLSDPFGSVSSLYGDGASIYVATGSNGVFTSPVGTTFVWTALNGAGDTTLPSLEVHSLRAVGTTLYASTRAGVATWDIGPAAPPSSPPGPAPSSPAQSSDSGGGGAINPSFALLLLAAVMLLRRGKSERP